MSKEEKVVYILKSSLRDLPNDKALAFIARQIVDAVKNHE